MSALEKAFGRTAQMIVLENLMKNRGTFTYLSGIAEETGLSHSSVSRVIEPLLAIEIITEKKVGKQIRTFTLDEENPVTRLLLKFYGDLSELLPE
jgi:predicted transcriptional regulator